MTIREGYSANVSMRFTTSGQSYRVAASSPHHLRLRDKCGSPWGEGVLSIVVDGNESLYPLKFETADGFELNTVQIAEEA